MDIVGIGILPPKHYNYTRAYSKGFGLLRICFFVFFFFLNIPSVFFVVKQQYCKLGDLSKLMGDNQMEVKSNYYSC